MRLHFVRLLATCAAACLACGHPDGKVTRAARHLTDAYALFSPLLSTTTYLVDRNGQVAHAWESRFAPGA